MAGEAVVYVADAGSHWKKNFHWVSSQSMTKFSTDPHKLAAAIASNLNSGRRVALGYESPLFVPADNDPSKLGKARKGECEKETGNRPFTAGAGASVLATGIQSLAWVLREVKNLAPTSSASTRWEDFRSGACDLFVWEAFVSGSEKAFPASHSGDAALAITAFVKASPHDCNPSCIECSASFSLAGAAILWAGLSSDFNLLAEPCVVLRPSFSPEEARGRLAGYKLRQAEAKRAKAAKKRGGVQ